MMRAHATLLAFALLVAPALAAGCLGEPDGSTPTPPTMRGNYSGGDGNATPPPEPALALTPVVDGLDSPVFVTHAGDGSGRLFIVEQPGRVRVWQGGTLQPQPFLDIRDRVKGGGEQGLLSVAFDPAFTENGRVFVSYTDRDGTSVLSRFVTDAIRWAIP